ncbi:vWA domain-containing protein [Sporosarcina aquimarina]|uniref:VWA domain-containing protein n=1 Tax=Sporosarcina aquimarina TaxID=114975 RepID=A0ABU4FXD7_9BACL|nr:VWA domain-containing protein [Sporosarcina aquimarina]MDW0109381.1 VWA domain-containing protein [Sporosarcina aquimarina]
MGFSSLANLWTLVFPLAVIAYYLFRKRFVSKTVSSTLFWTHDRREEQVSPYIKNLQRNLLLYLQLLALFLLVFLLLGPFVKQEKTDGIPLVFIIDSSATMLAQPTDRTLFETNRDTMKKLVEVAERRPISIVVTGKEPKFAAQDTGVTQALREAEQLSVQYEQSHIGNSIELVESIYHDQGAEVHIFTDSLERTALSNDNNKIRWHVHANEQKITNHSISRFGAVRKQDTVSAIVKVQHDTVEKESGSVQLKEAKSGKLLGVKKFEGEPGTEELISFQGIETDASSLVAELEEADSYSADDHEFTLLASERTRVVIDPALHELLKKAVEAIHDDVSEDGEAEQTADDVLRITNSADWLHKGSRPVLLIGRDDAEPVKAVGDIEVTDDSLFSIASPKEMYVEKIYPAFDGYEVLATIGSEPLIQRSPRGDVVFLADLESTDWPLQPTFPIFVWSVMTSLAEESDSLSVFTPLQRKSVVMANAADMYDMEGDFLTTTESSNTLQAPAKPGIYKVTDGDTEKLFAVQLESSEKNVAVGETYTIGNIVGTDKKTKQITPIIWPFLLPLLLLLLLEWEVQRRRGYPY